MQTRMLAQSTRGHRMRGPERTAAAYTTSDAFIAHAGELAQLGGVPILAPTTKSGLVRAPRTRDSRLVRLPLAPCAAARRGHHRRAYHHL